MTRKDVAYSFLNSINNKIVCKKCKWSWKKSESSEKDLYNCYKCNYDNLNKKYLNKKLDNNYSEDKPTERDACYEKAKALYKIFPSARASQYIAKCRKKSGKVIKSEKGTSLKRWTDEKWIDTFTGKPCGTGTKTQYCRPSIRINSDSAKTITEISEKELKAKQKEKLKVGMGKRVKKI